MEQVRAGDVWTVIIGGDKRQATILGPADAPGWWRCRDVSTGIAFVARQGWLIERIHSGDG